MEFITTSELLLPLVPIVACCIPIKAATMGYRSPKISGLLTGHQQTT
jgi:hypothetical protein